MSSTAASSQQHARPVHRSKFLNKSKPVVVKEKPVNDWDHFKIGDKVFYKTDNKSEGVVVSYLKNSKKPWSVHWFMTPTIGGKKYKFDRGVYKTNEIKGYYIQ
jgi:hypothetical protein